MKKRISPEFTTKSIRDARIPIFAFSTLWILFFHLSGNIGFPSGNIVWTAIRYFISFGNYGVDIFLILSAIGLSASMRKNKIKDFYYHRFKRVVIPYLIIALPFFVWYDLILHHSGLGSFIGNVSTVNYWICGNHPTWYVAFILIAYLLFPCIYKLDKKSKHISTLSLIICSVAIEVFFRVNNFAIYTNCERALSRIPVFLLGVLLSDIFLDNQKIHKVFVPISVVIIGLCLSICVLLPTDIMIQRLRKTAREPQLHGVLATP